MNNRSENIRKWEFGQSILELALSSILLLTIIGAMVDIGRVFIILVAIENAAGEGALYAASHPECLTLHNADPSDDTAPGTCEGTESIAGRIYAEGNTVASLNEKNTRVIVEIENDALITAGSTVRIKVIQRHTPLTPIGLLLWGKDAQVVAEARQQILSPPRPGYQYE